MTSGVIAQGCQHRLVAQRIDPCHQAAATLEHGKAELAALRCRLSPKAQLETFLDQASQAGALPGSERLRVGEQLVVEVERRLHDFMIQISVFRIHAETDQSPAAHRKLKPRPQAPSGRQPRYLQLPDIR